jgi:hypothetical protein
MKLHLSSLSPRSKPNPSASSSSPLPPVSDDKDDAATTLSFVMAAKASKARAIGHMSKALAALQTKTLYLITTDERYHALDVPGQYTSLSLALGMSFREYADLAVEGGFLRPASLLGRSGMSAPSSLRLEDCSDGPFCRPLAPSLVKKLGMGETSLVLGGALYHFVYRSFAAGPYVVPPLTCAPHMFVLSTFHRGGRASSTEPGMWEAPSNIPSMHSNARDENQVNDLARRVTGLSIGREGDEARSGYGATLLPAPRRHLVPQSRDPYDEVAEAWVQHGLALDFGLCDRGVRKGRDFPIPAQLAGVDATEPTRVSNGTIKMTGLKTPTPAMKLLAVHIAVSCCNYLHAGYTRQEVIAKAVVNIVCYDFGFVRPRGHTVFRKWVDGVGAALATNVVGALTDAGPPAGTASEAAPFDGDDEEENLV